MRSQGLETSRKHGEIPREVAKISSPAFGCHQSEDLVWRRQTSKKRCLLVLCMIVGRTTEEGILGNGLVYSTGGKGSGLDRTRTG